MSDWYYAKDNQQMGPKNESEVKASIATGEIPADTLVWKDGMDGWMPANQVPAFSFRPPPAPAKVQPAAPITPAPVVTTPFTPAATVTPTATTPSTFQTAPAASTTTATTTTTAVPAKPIDVSVQMQNALGSISTLNTGVGITGDPADVAKNKLVTFFSYFGILFLIPLIAAGTSPFAKYHANQGLILFLSFLVIFVPLGFVFGILSYILPSILIFLLSSLIYLVLMVAMLAGTVLGVINVNGGVMKPLPFIGGLFVIIK